MVGRSTRRNARDRLTLMDGDILLVVDSDGDGVPDRYKRWAGTIPHWPLGMRAEGKDLLVAARGSLLRLSDRDHDGWAEHWRSLSDSWDVSRDHHDWTTGIASWPGGGWVVGPATDDVRSRDVLGRHYLRGKAVHVAPDGATSVLADGLRYTTGWATALSDAARSSSPTTRGSRRRPARSTAWSRAAGTVIRARPTNSRPADPLFLRSDALHSVPLGTFGQRARVRQFRAVDSDHLTDS